MKLRNVNRGLVLGAALVLGTAVYVGIDNARFKDSKPEIEETVKRSVEAIAQSNVGKADEIESSWMKLLSEYFTNYSNIHDYGATKNSIAEEIGSGWFDDDDLGKITKAKTEISNITISKSGSDGANVEFEYSAYYEYTGSCPAYMSFDGISFLDGGDYDDYGNPIPEDKNASYGETLSGEAEMYLLRTDSGWKIGSMTNYGYQMDVKRLDEDAEAEGSIDRSSDAESENSDGTSEPSSDVIYGGGEPS